MTDLTYEEACKLLDLTQGSGSAARLEAAWADWGQTASTEDMIQALRASGWKDIGPARVTVMEPASGGINGYKGTIPVSYADPVNSNNVVRSSVRVPIDTTAEVVSERSVMSAKVGLREAGNFAIGSVVPAVAATGLGITLGKTIDSTLYELNPDFWDSHNMSSLNPETWNTITSDYDGIAGTLFDLIFGLDGDKTQAYIDEDAATYLAWWLATQGAFATGGYEATYDGDTSSFYDPNLTEISLTKSVVCTKNDGTRTLIYEAVGDGWLLCTKYGQGNQYWTFQALSISSGDILKITPSDGSPSYITGRPITTYNNTPFYYTSSTSQRADLYTVTGAYLDFAGSRTLPDNLVQTIGTIIFDGTISRNDPIEGIGTQDGATTPDANGWDSMANTKTGLQQQYPQLWDGAKHQDYVDENGQNRTKTLIPINLPNAHNPFDTQPTSGDRNQQDPLIDPTTATDELLDTITDLITTIIDILPDTGSGDSPVVPAPTGRASSLWKIYNPTQAQVDSFGAWLWDSSFVEQIKKLFNDPMQAIIGIHKVFATPSIGGTATIKVGYLDSEVPSKWVDDQYTTINCGTVSLSEYFSNVFDYAPYTRVSLYLPFIGIVDLDVADVMRGSISVTYHVDVLSGACLADVKVSRDASSAVLYQYSGSAIVTYPVSSGNYMGMVAGVLSVAGGLAGTIMSGGALAPAIIGGAVGMSHLHTDVSHSGGFSGCAGAMASKKPYLIISRPQTAMAGNYGHFTGKPANANVILNNCAGYTKVKSVYVSNISNATNEEKDMIEAQLKAGVLV